MESLASVWEYRIADVKLGRDGQAELNALGADGWEAVSMHAELGLAHKHAYVLLKRTKR